MPIQFENKTMKFYNCNKQYSEGWEQTFGEKKENNEMTCKCNDCKCDKKDNVEDKLKIVEEIKNEDGSTTWRIEIVDEELLEQLQKCAETEGLSIDEYVNKAIVEGLKSICDDLDEDEEKKDNED